MSERPFDRRRTGPAEHTAEESVSQTPFLQYRDLIRRLSGEQCDIHLPQLEQEIDLFHAIGKMTLHERMDLKYVLRQKAWPVYWKNVQANEEDRRQR